MVKAFNKPTKTILALLLAVAMLLPVFIFSTSASASGFYVSGTSLKDANGNTFVMRGVNIAHAWYTSYTETSIKGAAALGANAVRIVCANGQQWTKTTYSELQNIINWCKAANVVCILEVHDATGRDSTSDLNKCVEYWIEMKDLLNANTEYVILNLANEWYGTWNGSSWAEGNKAAIKSLRNAGITNTIMIDCAGWGQYPASIHEYGQSVFSADSQKNTIFSIHMYEYAGGDATTVKNNIDKALATGVPLVIGEFGGQHTNGDVDEYTIMSYCQQKGVGYLGWSWKGNSSDLGYLDIANDWSGSSLTTWGSTLFNDANGIKKTSKICSVFGNDDYFEEDDNSGSDDTSSDDTSSDDTTSDNDSSSSDYVSLFYGSASAGAWCQAVSIDCAKNGGSFDASNIREGGHFYVEYKGDWEKVELVLQSWSGGSSWGKVSISESGTANGNNFVKFSYNNCVNTFGSSDFANKLDKIHVGASDGNVEIISVCYDFGNNETSSDNTSSDDTSSDDTSSDDVTSDDTSSDDVTSDDTSSDDTTSDNTSSDYVSLFYGSASAGAWGQAVSIDCAKNGGSFDASNIKEGGHFYVEYKGDWEQVELVLQSWSGGSSWGKVSISESGTANGNNYVKFSYENCVNALGSSDFANKLDKIHAGAANGYVEIISVCYDFGNGASSDDTSSDDVTSDDTTSDDTSSDDVTSDDTTSDDTSSDDGYHSNYTSLFYGSAGAYSWGQAVSVDCAKNGGSFDASNIKEGGHFYVEYKGDWEKVELILQSWSGGFSWGKVSISESGTANGNNFVKFSYNNCVNALGTSDFANKLDKIHVGAMDSYVEIVSVCYCYPN